jgi:hypothetical protein
VSGGFIVTLPETNSKKIQALDEAFGISFGHSKQFPNMGIAHPTTVR